MTDHPTTPVGARHAVPQRTPNRNRRSIRLQGYDYSQSGAYFVTICTQNRECRFGEIVAGKMQLNVAGEMVSRWYGELENKFPDIECDAFVCMPNHVHFVVINVGADLRVRPNTPPDHVGADPRVCPNPPTDHPDNDTHPNHAPCPDQGDHVGADLRVRPNPPTNHPGNDTHPNHAVCPDQGEHTGSPLRLVVQWFKTMTTNEYIRGVKQHHWPPFPGKLWQRNYYERIVRNENELNRIRQYIINNPAKWGSDRENPEAVQLAVAIKRNFEEFGA